MWITWKLLNDVYDALCGLGSGRASVSGAGLFLDLDRRNMKTWIQILDTGSRSFAIKILGLFQVNFHRKNMFNLQKIIEKSAEFEKKSLVFHQFGSGSGIFLDLDHSF